MAKCTECFSESKHPLHNGSIRAAMKPTWASKRASIMNLQRCPCCTKGRPRGDKRWIDMIVGGKVRGGQSCSTDACQLSEAKPNFSRYGHWSNVVLGCCILTSKVRRASSRKYLAELIKCKRPHVPGPLNFVGTESSGSWHAGGAKR
jgi:hypothetical protein